MKRSLLTILLLLLIGAASCSSPRMPYEPAPGTYIRNQKPVTMPVIPQSPSAIYPPPLVRPLPLKSFAAGQPIIVIDPGHGGEDYGTHSLGTPKYHEKYLNLSTAQIVRNFLQQFGYKVIMTRTNDTFIPLDKRALFANEQKPTLFVSIHYNSAPSTEAEGIEVFYFQKDENKTRVTKSKQLAQSVLKRTVQNTQANSRGVKHGNYAVIRQTDMPAILIEGGFLTNEGEMERIKTVSYQKSLALGIAQGIQDYLSKQGLLAEK